MKLFKKVDSNNMKQEIEDQGLSIELTIKNELENIKNISKKLQKCERFVFSGCGDKYVVPLASKYLWNHISEKPLDVIQSWTLKNYPPKHLNSKTCVVFVSQSGTTYDTVDACKLAIEKKCKVVALTNLKEEKYDSLVELCENYKNGHVIRTHTKSYPEKSLPSTGSFHASLTALNLFTIFVNKGPQKFIDFQVNYIPKVVDSLSNSELVKKWAQKAAKKLKKFNNFYVVGDGPRYPVARKQARIMMMEATKVNACDIEGEEFVHSLIETLESKSNPLILLKPLMGWEDSFRNFEMVKKFWLEHAGKKKLTIINPFKFLDKKINYLFSGIDGDILSAFLYAPQLEWLSYYLALERGFDPSVGKLVKKVRNRTQIKKMLT
ncbi:MAG: SIS domain-containing protein [Candidatus Aenigmarchaeota archaeon]|nr:SIS domain-containing protein [Candidatus Aenigmarchaeota archaeon]